MIPSTLAPLRLTLCALALTLGLTACKNDPPATPPAPAASTERAAPTPATPAPLVIREVGVGGMIPQPLVAVVSAAIDDALGKTEGIRHAAPGTPGATLEVDVSAQATPMAMELPPRLTVHMSATVRDAGGKATSLQGVIAERDVPLRAPEPGEDREQVAKAQEALVQETLKTLSGALVRALVQTRALETTPDAALPALLARADLEDHPAQVALERVRESKLVAAYPAAIQLLKRTTSPRLTLAAAATLALGGHKEAEAPLIAAAERSSRDGQRTAHLALINLLPRVGAEPTRQYLSALAQSGAHPEVQHAARDALKRMDQPTAGARP